MWCSKMYLNFSSGEPDAVMSVAIMNSWKGRSKESSFSSECVSEWCIIAKLGQHPNQMSDFWTNKIERVQSCVKVSCNWLPSFSTSFGAHLYCACRRVWGFKFDIRSLHEVLAQLWNIRLCYLGRPRSRHLIPPLTLISLSRRNASTPLLRQQFPFSNFGGSLCKPLLCALL